MAEKTNIISDKISSDILWEKDRLETYHILEMAQMAIGEEPEHRIKEVKTALANNVIKAVTENPEILKQRYMIKNGEINPLF